MLDQWQAGRCLLCYNSHDVWIVLQLPWDRTSRISLMYFASKPPCSMNSSKKVTKSLLTFCALMFVPQTNVSFS